MARPLCDSDLVQLLHLYDLCDIWGISSTHGSHSDSKQYHQPPVRFVFSSFQLEVLCKIWSIQHFSIILKTPKIYVQFSQKWLKLFSKFQQIFQTDQSFFLNLRNISWMVFQHFSIFSFFQNYNKIFLNTK